VSILARIGSRGECSCRSATRKLTVETGEAAEFATMTPHAFAAINGPAELIVIFDRDGQHALTSSSRSASRPPTSSSPSLAGRRCQRELSEAGHRAVRDFGVQSGQRGAPTMSPATKVAIETGPRPALSNTYALGQLDHRDDVVPRPPPAGPDLLLGNVVTSNGDTCEDPLDGVLLEYGDDDDVHVVAGIPSPAYQVDL
jgi:hypothetical protein